MLIIYTNVFFIYRYLFTDYEDSKCIVLKQQLFPKAKLGEIVAVEGTINLISSGQSVNTRKFFIYTEENL